MLRRWPCLCALALVPVWTVAAPAAQDGKRPNFELAVNGDRVSLRVVNGSLVEVVEELARVFDFEVIAHLKQDVRLDADFVDLPLSDAIRKICAPVGYVEAPDPQTGKITRLVLVSSDGPSANRAEARREPLPERPAPELDAKPPDPNAGRRERTIGDPPADAEDRARRREEARRQARERNSPDD